MHIYLSVFILGLVSLTPAITSAQVKLSAENTCICPGGDDYGRTTNFRDYPTLDRCMSANIDTREASPLGQCPAPATPTPQTQEDSLEEILPDSPMPNTQSGESWRPTTDSQNRGILIPNSRTPQTQTPEPSNRFVLPDPSDVRTSTPLASTYRREYFGDWQDGDADCLDTRAELLQAFSTTTTTMSEDGCTVLSGNWIDPYSGQSLTQASDLVIDHVVPLEWAWDRGADDWEQIKRDRFVNEPMNLFATYTDSIRTKRGNGPLEWLPGNSGFHCAYVTRFEKVSQAYQLSLSAEEQYKLRRQRQSLCN